MDLAILRNMARLRVLLLSAEECIQIWFLCCNLSHSLVSFAGVSASKASSVKVRLFGPLEKFESAFSMTATVYFLLNDSCLPFERKRYCKHGYIVLSFHLLVFEEEIGYREAFWFSSGELEEIKSDSCC